jgi:hypothetical protein
MCDYDARTLNSVEESVDCTRDRRDTCSNVQDEYEAVSGELDAKLRIVLQGLIGHTQASNLWCERQPLQRLPSTLIFVVDQADRNHPLCVSANGIPEVLVIKLAQVLDKHCPLDPELPMYGDDVLDRFVLTYPTMAVPIGQHSAVPSSSAS